MAEVVVYTTPTCPWCEAAKEFFRKHDIDYEEYDVAYDERKAMEMIQKSGQMGTPVIDIDGEIVIGFDKPRIVELLGLDEY